MRRVRCARPRWRKFPATASCGGARSRRWAAGSCYLPAACSRMPLSDFVDRHRTTLSIGAMLVGVLAVLSGVTRERQGTTLLPGEAARVNGHAIDSDTFQRTFAAFTTDL